VAGVARGLGVYVSCGIEEAGLAGASDPQNVALRRGAPDRRDVLLLHGAKRRIAARGLDRRDVLRLHGAKRRIAARALDRCDVLRLTVQDVALRRGRPIRATFCSSTVQTSHSNPTGERDECDVFGARADRSVAWRLASATFRGPPRTATSPGPASSMPQLT